jgi:hypothetical protein
VGRGITHFSPVSFCVVYGRVIFLVLVIWSEGSTKGLEARYLRLSRYDCLAAIVP